MAYTHTVSAPNGLFEGLRANYQQARAELFRRRVYANAVRSLNNLTDRQLDDIGIPRSEIRQRAYQSVHGSPALEY